MQEIDDTKESAAMPKKTLAASYTIEITEAQRNFVLSGLVNELLDAKRYLSSMKESEEPGPLDSCCDAHLARYELRKSGRLALEERKTAIEATIELFSIEGH